MMTGDRVLSLFTALALQLAGFGLLLFWTMGAVLLLTRNGGQFVELNLSGWTLTYYWLYPAFLLVFSLVGWLFFWKRQDLLATAALSAPVGLMLLYYLFLAFR